MHIKDHNDDYSMITTSDDTDVCLIITFTQHICAIINGMK